jgi:hypothetical protein
MASVGKVPMGLKVAHGTPRSVATSTFQKKCVSATTASGVSSLMSLSCPRRISSASSKAASSTRQASAATTVEMSDVLDAWQEAVDGRERVRRHPNNCGGVFAARAAPCESRTDDRRVRRGDGDGGLEVEGEVGDGAMWLLAKKGMSRMRSFLLCLVCAYQSLYSHISPVYQL